MTDDEVLAGRLATAAGGLLLGLRGAGGAEVKQLGDQRSHEFLMDALRRERPDDRIRSEEAAQQEAGTGQGRVWIVDPLDGTREFGELDRVDWAVHVALVIDGVAVAGAVALPAQGRTLVSGGELPAPVVADRPLRILVSRTRPSPQAEELARRLDGELVPLGSAGAKAMAVVLGDADVYAHSGGQYEWDSAAPVAVARSAGFHASRLDGRPLMYDSVDPWLPDLLICRPDVASSVIAITKELV